MNPHSTPAVALFLTFMPIPLASVQRIHYHHHAHNEPSFLENISQFSFGTLCLSRLCATKPQSINQ